MSTTKATCTVCGVRLRETESGNCYMHAVSCCECGTHIAATDCEITATSMTLCEDCNVAASVSPDYTESSEGASFWSDALGEF